MVTVYSGKLETNLGTVSSLVARFRVKLSDCLCELIVRIMCGRVVIIIDSNSRAEIVPSSILFSWLLSSQTLSWC